MTTAHSEVPLIRRIWFADTDAISARDTAADAPDWSAGKVPTLIVPLSEPAYELLAGAPSEQRADQILEAYAERSIAGHMDRLLADETACYVQITDAAVVDFGPSLGLIEERLLRDRPRVLSTQMLEIGRYRTTLMQTEKPGPECWIRTDIARESLGSIARSDGLGLAAVLDAIVSQCSDIIELSLVSSAYFPKHSKTIDDHDSEMDRIHKVRDHRYRMLQSFERRRDQLSEKPSAGTGTSGWKLWLAKRGIGSRNG